MFGGSNTSVNSRVCKDKLLLCMYGACLKRLINWTVAARRRYPDTHICKQGQFQVCISSMPSQHPTAFEQRRRCYARIFTRDFWRIAQPNEWGVLAEPICDIANVLLHDDNWNPRDLHSPIQHLVPMPITIDNDIQFGEGKELIVNIPINPRGMNDVCRRHHPPHSWPAEHRQHVTM